jgi:hypothetical protein
MKSAKTTIIVVLLFVSFLAKSQPTLKVVAPNFINAAPNKGSMSINWDYRGLDVYQYKIRYKTNNGKWNNWVELPYVNGIPAAQHYTWTGLDENNDIYTFQVQAVQGMSGFNSDKSNELSNSFRKVWPVVNNGTNSMQIMHGYNQPYSIPGYDIILHEGIDIQGSPNTMGGTVLVPVGGIIKDQGNQNGANVNIEVNIDGQPKYYQLGHLFLPKKFINGNSVQAGDTLGVIDLSIYNIDDAHTHCSFWSDYYGISTSLINPYEMWDVASGFKDPQNMAPEVFDLDNNGESIRFKKGPHSTNPDDYFDANNPVYGSVDIIAECIDKQNAAAPWQNPHKIGY